MEKVKQLLFHWANEILGESQLRKKVNGVTSPLQHLQNLYSQKPQPSGMKMMLIIADELDYLITKDRAVLHDLFMLTTFPFSRCILIGIANAIDLADRFLPKLQSLNCKPTVVTFRAYSKDQILKILHERLMVSSMLQLYLPASKWYSLIILILCFHLHHSLRNSIVNLTMYKEMEGIIILRNILRFSYYTFYSFTLNIRNHNIQALDNFSGFLSNSGKTLYMYLFSLI
ncbi:cell division control protein 6 homolog B-like isoform X2 [Quercus lobata]|uniref:cell division control protein 6 homolog B-like isoform X2 n=1 Tax=Quercus lobata TaxID=97700 RepID=UPI0012466ED7|nr:cell division control protein 6 homolog B-like isoform X2 [Quercus lobata]